MSNINRRVPVSIENFAEIRQNNYFYVDKTKLIEQIIEYGNKITLFTRQEDSVKH